MRLAGPGLGGSTSSLAGFPSLRTRQGRIQGLEAKPHRLTSLSHSQDLHEVLRQQLQNWPLWSFRHRRLP